MKTIAFISQKGGVGKTTLALHLAVRWTQPPQGQPNVAVIDLDPQASAANWGDRRDASLPVVRPTFATRLKQELKAIREAGGEVAILDTAPHSDNITLEAAEAADLVVIPCRPSILDLEALAGTVKLIKTAGVPILAVLNAVVPHVPDAAEAEAAITRLGAAISPVRISRRVAFSRALIRGLTAQEYEPQGRAAQEIEQFFQVVYGQVMPQEEHAMAGGRNG